MLILLYDRSATVARIYDCSRDGSPGDHDLFSAVTSSLRHSHYGLRLGSHDSPSAEPALDTWRSSGFLWSQAKRHFTLRSGDRRVVMGLN